VGDRAHYKSFVMDSARWEGFVFRPDDIIISTPPKCGTTWTQMIVAMLVVQDPSLPRPLAEMSPWLDMLTTSLDDVVALLEAQEHRRFIKSHTPLDGLPWDDRVTYICVARDPRDVGFSWDNHLLNIDLGRLIEVRAAAVGLDDVTDADTPPPLAGTELGRFWQWVEEASPPSAVVSSLASTMHHLRTFWEARHRPNVVLVHYADLMRDLEGEMRRLAQRLGIVVPEARWPALVDAARLDQMRARADDVVPNSNHALWRDNQRFFQQGGIRWRAHLGDDELNRYWARLSELGLPAELSAWAHDGAPHSVLA
jgi:hypothetical protein